MSSCCKILTSIIVAGSVGHAGDNSQKNKEENKYHKFKDVTKEYEIRSIDLEVRDVTDEFQVRDVTDELREMLQSKKKHHYRKKTPITTKSAKNSGIAKQKYHME